MTTRRRHSPNKTVMPALKAGAKKVLGGYLNATQRLADKIAPYANKLPKIPSGRGPRRRK